MSRIRSKDTKPELIVRHYLFSRGYRYRKNCKRLPGTPDIVMRKYGVVIFIHGCFWHGHEDSHLPKTNVEFWRKKIERNKARDAENKKKLMDMGWGVMTVWECQLKPDVREKTLKEIEYWINKNFIERMQPLKRYPEFHEEENEGRMVAEERFK
jgi:DNA mismatch endonuclease (patch repair protein)